MVDILELFLAVTAQWEDVALFLSPEGFSHFFNRGGKFLALKRLALSSWGPIPVAHGVDLRESFPVLEDLKLELSHEAFPRHLLLPWAQIRRCVLNGAQSRDVMWIASQLTAGTEISAFRGANIDDVRFTSPTRTLISSLTLTQCGEIFVMDLLSSLVAPALETLVVESAAIVGDTLVQHIIHFLDQSACSLRRLRIDTAIDEDHLVSFFESPRARSIVYLDLAGTPISIRGITTLASHLGLRTLVLRGGPELHEPLLTALAKHRPFIRSGISQQQQDTLPPVGELEIIILAP